MTIIVFLIDTSASMNQRAYLGGRPTLLDIAKGAVETFVKVRQRSPESRGDRYMLLTFEDPPQNIKAAWKENLGTFMNELKNLRCTGLTTMGAALKHAFDVLNINRMQTGIDTYGQGRCPFYLEPSVIVVITDGGKLTTSTGVQEEFNLPMHSPIPGCELTREPFRWDQRLFSLVLRLAGTPAIDRDTGLVPNDTSPIDAMCEVTGGRSYCVTSHRMLLQCIDSLVQKVQSGVVINFEKVGPDPPMPHDTRGTNGDGKEIEEIEPVFKEWDRDILTTPNHTDHHKNGTTGRGQVLLGASTGTPQPWHSCRKLIYVPKSAQKGFPVGFWPIPESFWPDQQNQTLPPRSAHPNVKFSCTSQDPMVIENLPFDKYELEPSPLTQFILARKQPTICWQVFVPNSCKNSEVGHPFGYLKASTNLTCVNLFVMPYNYPVLLPLLDELFKVHRQKQTPEWRTSFTNYLKTMPPYYAPPLRRALSRMGASGTLAQNLIPENMDNCLSYSVVNYLKRLKNEAKKEYERMCNDVSSKQQQLKLVSQVTEGVRVAPKSHLKHKELVSHPMLQDKFHSLREQLSEFNGFIVGVSQRRGGRQGCQSFKNAFDIPRKQLLDQVIRMRANFLQNSSQNTKLIDQDVVHSMPISQMGNYQEYLKKQVPALREVESTPVRQHMFGNPFKIDKRMMVDEADIDLVGTGSSQGRGGASKRSASAWSNNAETGSPRPHKRKQGPIPKEVTVKRPVSPAITSPGSSPSVSPASSPAYIPPSLMEPPDISPPPTPGSSLPLLNGDIGDDERVMRSDSPALVIDESPTSPSPPPPSSSPIPIIPPVSSLPPLSLSLTNCISSSVHQPSPLSSPTLTPGPPILQPYDTRALLGLDDEPPALTPEEEQPPRLVVQATPRPQSPDSLRKHNLKVRQAAYREVRRPGTNYKPLMDELDRMKGSPTIRVKLLKEVINESLRFKRRNLASCLDKRLKRLMEEVMALPGTNGSR